MVRIENSKKLSNLYPEEISIPIKDVIDKLNKDDIVKMVFCDDDREICTKLWVKITDRKGKFFSGLMQMNSQKIPELKLNDMIRFKDDNIIDVWKDGFLVEEIEGLKSKTWI